MGTPRILILEDDPALSLHLEALVDDTLDAVVVTATSVAEARAILAERLDFALLDVDVADGTTYDIALWLADRRIAFAFVSASNRDHLPIGLKDATFIAKPYDDAAIVALLEHFDRKRGA